MLPRRVTNKQRKVRLKSAVIQNLILLINKRVLQSRSQFFSKKRPGESPPSGFPLHERRLAKFRRLFHLSQTFFSHL